MENKYKELYDRYRKEQDEFENWLRQQPWDTIRHHCYDYGVREDILLMISDEILDEDDAAALLESGMTLEKLLEQRAFGYVDSLEPIREALSAIAWDITLAKKNNR